MQSKFIFDCAAGIKLKFRLGISALLLAFVPSSESPQSARRNTQFRRPSKPNFF